MAGLWVVAVVVTSGFIAVVSACILSLVLYILARGKLRAAGQSGHKLTTVGMTAPFIGLFWLVIVLLIHVRVSNSLAHQDCGLSGDPYVTLPDGYVVGSRNTYDGYLVAPGFTTDTPRAGRGYVRSIVNLDLVDGRF